MKADENHAVSPGGGSAYRRLFLLEPGWRVELKVGSQREYCYMMAPGQDHYHRLFAGEILVQRGDERLCVACAERRGLLAYEPKGLRESTETLHFEVLDPASTLELILRDENDRPL